MSFRRRISDDVAAEGPEATEIQDGRQGFVFGGAKPDPFISADFAFKTGTSNSTSSTSSRSFVIDGDTRLRSRPESSKWGKTLAVIDQRELFAVPIPLREHAARSVPERDASISERFGCVAREPSVKDLAHVG